MAKLLVPAMLCVLMAMPESAPAQVSADFLKRPVDWAWSPTAEMNVARSGHTATLLEDGRVLVAGGSNRDGLASVNGGYQALGSAELYDPITRSWTMTGAMAEPHWSHKAVRLLDGRVLAVSERSAELFDPASGTWGRTGAMITIRYDPTLTVLADGAVLAVGGAGEDYNNDLALASAEIYDPTTGRWRRAASMATGRYWHTASLLANGTVLVTAGATLVEYHGYTALAEIYDPVADRWTSAGETAPARSLHAAATLTDGSVVVVGGYSSCLSANRRLCSYVTTARYVPGEGWRAGANLIAPRNSHTVTRLPSGYLLAVGGQDWTQQTQQGVPALASTEIYDPHADLWIAGPKLAALRQRHSTTLLHDGTVLVAGGGDSRATTMLKSAETFAAVRMPRIYHHTR